MKDSMLFPTDCGVKPTFEAALSLDDLDKYSLMYGVLMPDGAIIIARFKHSDTRHYRNEPVPYVEDHWESVPRGSLE